MPYRTELRRPDLKGTFRCSLCSKIFCHSSSLSRHRMQAHFKSYTCTLCNKEITSNETLRAHMYKKHQISRMFMCRCCNWAFPDKTSLHIHMQAMATGNPGNVSIIAKSSSSPPPGQGHHTPQQQHPTNGSPAASSIFPAMPSREELINRLRERAMIGGFAPPSGLDLSSLFPNFSKLNNNNSSAIINASGDGNNNRMNGGTSNGLADISMLDADEINCEDGEDGMMAEVDYGDSIEGSEDGLSIENQISPSRRCSTDSSGKKEESYMNSTPISMVPLKTETPQLQMPILRSAISSSPLNSLMYHKKLSNALRNKQRVDHHHSSMTNFLNPNFSMASPQSEYVPSPVPPQTNVRNSASPPLQTRIKEERCTPTRVKEERCTPPSSRPVINVLRDIPDSTPSIDSHISPTDSASSNSSAHSTCCPSSTPPADAKSGPCFHCQVMKGKLAQAENRCRFLESRTTSQESKISRLENRVSTLESNNRRYETEAVSLRDHCENLERKILECQERALKYLTNNNFDADTTKKILHDVLETCRVYKP